MITSNLLTENVYGASDGTTAIIYAPLKDLVAKRWGWFSGLQLWILSLVRNKFPVPTNTLKPTVLELDMGHACSLRCTYCSVDSNGADKRLKMDFDKDVFIKWAYENGIPLHKARTCVKSFNIECGDCPTCWDRRRGYKEAGVKDPTKYRFPMSSQYPTYYDHEKEEKHEKRSRS